MSLGCNTSPELTGLSPAVKPGVESSSIQAGVSGGKSVTIIQTAKTRKKNYLKLLYSMSLFAITLSS